MSQTKPRREAPLHDPDAPRLTKTLALAGLGSRRSCEGLISAGRVVVDGQRIKDLGTRIDPGARRIEVDGLPVETNVDKVTLALHKPLGVVSAMTDPEGRPNLGDYVQNRQDRLYHIGRLDADSEGLILLTNDGELANRVSHPSHELVKTYLVTVEGRVAPRVVNTLRRGVDLLDGFAKADRITLVDAIPGATMLEIDLHQGRNRIIRRMFDQVGHPVTRLVRTRIGPIRLADLKPGRSRVLQAAELAALKKQVGL
ncbi:MAG: rRNA pseudouridine synthase [Micrococcales bacterium]|nr:rRNA pseudouridine synthase [Micrococcales bacterium]